MDQKLTFTLLDEIFILCKLSAGSSLPTWVNKNYFYAVAFTPDEVSLLCSQIGVPFGVEAERDWRVLKVEKIRDIVKISGISFAATQLESSNIVTLVLSTFVTDYMIVREEQLEQAVKILQQSGHQINNLPAI